MNTERISLIPAGSEDRASSRIRVYSLQRSLVAMGKVATLGYWAEADVLFIQKTLTRHVLSFAHAFRKKGGLVVYDVDDLGAALLQWAPRSYVHRMLQTAQLMTTDTIGHRDALAADFGVRNIEIIPDCIDYYPAGPVDSKALPGGPLRILWFGVFDGRSLDRYSKALSNLGNAQLVLITDQGSIKENARRFKNVEFHAWDRSDFISILQSCHLSCLVHESDSISLMKSNNRMIASITWGVPAVVSRTPEFDRTAREAGVDYAVFGNEEELLVAIDLLRNEASRREYLRAAQPQIWRTYSPEAVARRFLTVADTYFAASSLREPSMWQSTCFRIRTTSEIAGEQFPLARRVIERGLWALRSRSLRLLFRPSLQGVLRPKRGPTSTTAALVTEPGIEDIRLTLLAFSTDSFLEVGNGWGQTIKDVAVGLNGNVHDRFRLDIGVENSAFLRKNQQSWDVLFTRGVMFMLPEPLQMAYAVNNMLMLARKKIVIWERPETCEFMRRFTDSPKFEFHPIEPRRD